MTTRFFSIIILALASTAVWAQSPAKVLKDAERALGGAKAIQRTTSLMYRGKVTRRTDAATGSIVIRTARPNLYSIRFDVGGFEVESGYNGRSGWMRDSRDGLRTLTGRTSVDFQSEAAFRNALWLDAKREKSKLVSGGQAQVDGRPSSVVVLNTAKGSTARLFFDTTTKLLVREEFSAGETTRSFEYGDFRPVNGIPRPHRIKLELDGAVYDATIDEVAANTQIARSEFDFPNRSNEPLPDVPALLAQLQSNEDKVEGLLDTYSYVQTYTRRAIGKDGVLRDTGSMTYQLSFYKGQRISRLIEKDGKPLSASDQEDEDKRAAKEVEKIDERLAKKDTDSEDESRRRVSVAEVLRASSLLNPRRERFRGRDVIVFDFEPNPNFDYKNAKSMLKFFGKTAGAMWIDEKDKQVVRLEAFLADSFNVGGGVLAKLKKGASFTLEQERVNDEIWLPSRADINMSVRVLLVKGIDLNQVIRSYDYRKFTTEVKDAKVNDVKDDN